MKPSFETESSKTATVVLADPADAISDGGAAAAGLTENPVSSSFQQDLVVSRFIYRDISWKILESSAVIQFTGFVS